jgi:hypothetical protein
VVVGDPASFSAEHSEQEPALVFVKPITAKPAQTNLLISTTRGQQISILLISPGELASVGRPAVDFLVRYKPEGGFLIEPSDYPMLLIAETVNLAGNDNRSEAPVRPVQNAVALPRTRAADRNPSTLDELLERQRKARMPDLYGGKPGVSNPDKERIKAGVSEVIDQGREVVVLFAVVNPQEHSVELMPPQVQLGGRVRSGKLFKHSRWSTAEQYPIADYRLSRRRIGPQERADGVVVFSRPPYKQSNETLFLQIAESGAVDRPALAPIGFGISKFDFSRQGGAYGRPPGE